ncbi:hypothetical protein [Nocardioides gilvus]|uniref:hypothetical protein n=1 Tax=Nocardioides gilvus TaxID=1735589 RepID=UPI000D74F9A1|nr:hypothetical protein [Nocardioides gilvus]
MPMLLLTHIRLQVALLDAVGRRRDERGDVPGWVLIVVMSVGIVAALGALAEDQLTVILERALSSVGS